jgi:hypothetical protein
MLDRGNEVSRGMAALAVRSLKKPPLNLTLLYGLVLDTKQEPLWEAGQVQHCLLVALGELYSPTYESILYGSGFVLPLPGQEDRIPTNTMIRFLAAIENAFTQTPKLERVAKLTIVKNWERRKVLELMDDPDIWLHPLPKLMWRRDFHFAKFIERRIEQQMHEQAAERARLELVKSRGVADINRFLAKNNRSMVIRSESLAPPSDSKNCL